MNRSLAARWSLLSGSGQLYLLWPSQASLYRSPIHQHPFFSLQHKPCTPLYNTHFKQWGTAFQCSASLCSLLCLLCCHSIYAIGNPPILCLTPLAASSTFFLLGSQSHAATRKGKDIDGLPISSSFLGEKLRKYWRLLNMIIFFWGEKKKRY